MSALGWGRTLLWMLAAGGAWAVVQAGTRPLTPMDPAGAAAPRAARPTPPPPITGDSLAAAIVRRDPFRPDRHPAPAEEGPEERQTAVSASPYRVVGIVTGARPSAVLLGMPGAPRGAVVLEGDTVGVFVVRRVTPGAVELVGADTVLVLRFEGTRSGEGSGR